MNALIILIQFLIYFMMLIDNRTATKGRTMTSSVRHEAPTVSLSPFRLDKARGEVERNA